jgi:hypothetical protein
VGRGIRSSCNAGDDEFSMPSLKSKTLLASSLFSEIKSVAIKKGMPEKTKGKRTKALTQETKALMQDLATISHKDHKAEKRGIKQRVKSKTRLSEEIQLLRGMLYQLQSKISETNVKENTASCLCCGYNVSDWLEWFSWGDDETVSTDVSSDLFMSGKRCSC